jgi:hypothetical protein
MEDAGLKILADVKEKIGVPVLTDIHEDTPLDEVANVVDVLQTPAFLCRQTNYIQAVARTGLPINIKKGQFLAPWDMKHVIEKFAASNAILKKAIDYEPSTVFLIIETSLLILFPIAVSWVTSSVMVVWSILGSTVTFLIAFTFPGAFFVKIRRHKGCNIRNSCAFLLALSSFLVMWLCVWQAFSRLDVAPCTNIPNQKTID